VVAGQHTEPNTHRQLRFVHVLALGALCATAVHPLAAQQEAERVVRGLKFVGNQAIDGYTLSTVISTSKSSFFATAWWVRWLGLGAKRYFDEVEFQRDVVRLILFYRQSGYMKVVVDTTVRRTPRDVYVLFRIYEGEPVRVHQLDIDGVAGIADLKALRRALPLKVGDPFDRALFQASADTIGAWLRNRGYPYAVVLRNFDSDAAAESASVHYAAVPGRHMRVGQIVVEGVERVDTSTVLHTLSVRPGEQYREDLLYQSQRDLYSTGTFRSATVALRDSEPPANGDSTAGILVSVAEGPRHRIRLGGGYGTQDCFRAQAGWSSYGFLGKARVLDLGLRVSKIGVGWPLDANLEKNLCGGLINDRFSDTLNYNLTLTLFQPAFLSPSHSASVGVFAERRSEVDLFTRTQVGANFGVTFNARRRVPIGVAYTYSVGRTDANPAVLCSVFSVCDDSTQRFLNKRRPFASLGVTAAMRTENNPLDPTSGGHVGITLLHTSRLIGSDPLYEFNRGELEIARYMPIGRRGTFAWRIHAGALFLFSRDSLSGQNVQFVPPEQRFYAGGANSVRGFRTNELGPRVYVVDKSGLTVDSVSGDTAISNVQTAPTGGNSVVYANAELRVPAPVFSERLQFAAFVDLGQVYVRQRDLLSFKSLRVTPGAGFRITTPLGPVRVDVAYNGYAPEAGVLLFADSTNLVKVRQNYQQTSPSTFLKRLVVQFAIGQAF
jgi:outer membrane protein insertion porin family